MRRVTKLTFALALLLVVFATPAMGQATATIAFEHIAIVDVVTGSVASDMTVIVDEGRISAIVASSTSDRPPVARVVDATGKYMIPGLWDMHVHIADRGYLPQFIAHGVTGVRDMGGGLDAAADGCESLKPGILDGWRAEIKRGESIGPSILLSGPAVSGTGATTSLPARTPEEAIAAVNRLKAMGVDFVKVYEKIPLVAYLSLARAAQDVGLVITGHVPMDSVSLLDAINAGQRSIEHVRDPMLMCFTPDAAELAQFFADDGWQQDDVAWGRQAHAQCQDVLAAARQYAVWFTPTLVVEHAKVAVDNLRWVEARAQSWLPASVRDAHARYAQGKHAQTPPDRASDHRWWQAQQRLVGRLAKSDIALLAGTDSACEGGLPGEDLHTELVLLVDAGLTPRQALAAATWEPARYFNEDTQRGRIVVGAIADMVVLDANPLDAISNTRRIDGVVLRGQWLDRARLAALAL